jgi:hypothetical protein
MGADIATAMAQSAYFVEIARYAAICRFNDSSRAPRTITGGSIHEINNDRAATDRRGNFADHGR